jgi:hypothetical protein
LKLENIDASFDLMLAPEDVAGYVISHFSQELIDMQSAALMVINYI